MLGGIIKESFLSKCVSKSRITLLIYSSEYLDFLYFVVIALIFQWKFKTNFRDLFKSPEIAFHLQLLRVLVNQGTATLFSFQ